MPRKTHGLGTTSTYHIWYGMLERCRNPKCISWPHYGGRGITVCDQWQTFENFYADMGPRPAGTSIDRIDGNRGYEPGNVRWATELEQQRNRRGVKCNVTTARTVRAYWTMGLTQSAIAKLIDMSPSSVSRILSGATWK